MEQPGDPAASAVPALRPPRRIALRVAGLLVVLLVVAVAVTLRPAARLAPAGSASSSPSGARPPGSTPSSTARAVPSPQNAAPVSFRGVLDGVPQYLLGPGANPPSVRPSTRPFLADYALPIGSLTRSYRVFIPTGLSGPAPVVVELNGFTLKADPDTYMHFRNLARRRHFIVLEPRGYGSSWNAGSCCGVAAARHVDDVTALTVMIRSAAHLYPINPHRVYLAGFSNGGMFAYDYACREPGRVAAIGVVAAVYVSSCTPSRAVPVMHVHGRADGVLPIRGGYSPLLHRSVPSVARTDAVFRALDAAARTPERTVILAGADHGWPQRGGRGNFNTTAELFAFFWRFQR